MPASHSACVVPVSVSERGAHAVQLESGGLGLRRGDEDEEAESKNDGEAEKPEACGPPYGYAESFIGIHPSLTPPAGAGE